MRYRTRFGYRPIVPPTASEASLAVRLTHPDRNQPYLSRSDAHSQEQNALDFLLRTVVITIIAAGLVILAAVALSLAPLWIGPALPAGSARLNFATATPSLFLACPTALLAPVRVASSDDDLVLVSVASGEPLPVVWPGGFAAWRIDGRAVLAGPYGDIIGREGDELDHLGGGLGADDIFQVCGAGLSGQIGLAPWFFLSLSIALGIVIVAVPRALWTRRREAGTDQPR